MISTNTLADCYNCGAEVEWMAPEPGDETGNWRHTSTFSIACYPTNRRSSTAAMPAEDGHTTPPAPAAPADVDQAAYLKRRAAELITTLADCNATLDYCTWAGTAKVVLAELTGQMNLL